MLFTKDEFKTIVSQNPNKSPQSIIDTLLKDGNQIEGFNDSPSQNSQPPQGNVFEQKSFGEKMLTSSNPFEGKSEALEAFGNVASIPRNFNIGVAKSVAGLAQGMSTLGQKTFGKLANKIVGGITGKEQPEKIVELPKYITEAEGGMQSAGKLAGDIGTFFVPGGAVAKGSKLVEAGIGLSKLAQGGKVANLSANALKLLSKSALSALEAGGVSTLQTGDIEEGKKTAKLGAIIPVAGGILGKVTRALGTGSEALAKQIEKVNLRLTPVQKRDLGKKLDDVTNFLSKQGVTGTPEQRYQKVEELYNIAEDKFSSFIKRYAPTVTAKTDDIVSQVKSIVGKYKNDRDILSIEKQIDEFVDLLKTRHKGNISLDALNKLKRSTFKGAYNKAGQKVLDAVEHEIGRVLNKNLQKITEGLNISGQDIKTFNKGYGTLIEAKKLLDIARTRPELGLVGKLVSSSVGGAIGTAVSGGVGTALGILAGQTGGKLVAGTAMRSQVEKLLIKLSKIGKLTESEAGSIKNFIFGGGKKINLSPKEKKIADAIAKRINEAKPGLSIEDVSNKSQPLQDHLIQEARKYKTTVNINDKNDLDYLRRILSEDNIKDIQKGKMTNFRGTPYEDLARVNLISETPKTIEQQLAGKVKEVKLKSDTFYHGTTAENASGIRQFGFKRGSDLPEETVRGGGYGKMQSSISFTETPKDASRFSTLTKNGEIIEAKLKPNAKVVSIEGVEDAVDLEDYMQYLKKNKIDAVYIGGGEKELVVINPKAVNPVQSQPLQEGGKIPLIEKYWNKVRKSPDVKQEVKRMSDFIDYVRGKKPENVDLEIEARRILEGLGIKGEKTNKQLASFFDKLLSHTPKGRKNLLIESNIK